VLATEALGSYCSLFISGFVHYRQVATNVPDNLTTEIWRIVCYVYTPLLTVAKKYAMFPIIILNSTIIRLVVSMIAETPCRDLVRPRLFNRVPPAHEKRKEGIYQYSNFWLGSLFKKYMCVSAHIVDWQTFYLDPLP
jgi:hypothetical protein